MRMILLSVTIFMSLNFLRAQTSASTYRNATLSVEARVSDLLKQLTFRDPRWGRGQETYGEDPFLTAAMGSAFVRGMQGTDKDHLKTAALSAPVTGPQLSAPDKRKWKQLFNGKDLKDWTVKIKGHEVNDNSQQTFVVKDGVIRVDYSNYSTFNDQFGHMFYKQPYSYYLLAVEYRFIGQQVAGGPGWAKRNSGVMIHCQPPSSMLKDQDFPISIEVQFLGGDSTGTRTTCNLCTPGTHVVMKDKLVTDHCINSTSPTYRGDQWIRAEVLVLGDSVIKHIVNGDTVLTYNKPQYGGGVVNNFDPAYKKDGQPITGGYIALQSESHPIEFRKVEIINLEEKYRRKKREK